MNGNKTSELEANIETTIVAAHAVFKSQNNSSICELLVNSQPTVEFVDGVFDLGRWANDYEVTLTTSLEFYSKLASHLEDTRHVIRSMLNEVHQVNGEYVSNVRITIDPQNISDWRKQTGLFRDGQVDYSQAESEALWGIGLRIFISHASEQKEKASELGGFLEDKGIAVFVAHKHIKPISEWPREILKALTTMDAFIAVLTCEFKASNWCSQELGFAVARGVPIFPIRAGEDPYGFIGSIQALNFDEFAIEQEVDKQFSGHPRLSDSRVVHFERFVQEVEESRNFYRSIELSSKLKDFENMTVEQGDKLAQTVNDNVEAWGSFGFNSRRKENGNLNIAEHLIRMTGEEYVINQDNKTTQEWLVRRKNPIAPKSPGERRQENDDVLADLPW